MKHAYPIINGTPLRYRLAEAATGAFWFLVWCALRAYAFTRPRVVLTDDGKGWAESAEALEAPPYHRRVSKYVDAFSRRPQARPRVGVQVSAHPNAELRAAALAELRAREVRRLAEAKRAAAPVDGLLVLPAWVWGALAGACLAMPLGVFLGALSVVR